MPQIEVTAKQLGGVSYVIKLDSSCTALELKQHIVEQSETSPSKMNISEMRLVYKGKQLKDDDTLEKYEPGSVIYIAMKFAKPTPPSPQKSDNSESGNQDNNSKRESNNIPTTSVPSNPFANLEASTQQDQSIRRLLSDPDIQRLVSNGQIPEGMPSMTPEMVSELMSNPAVRQMMSDPSFMSNMMQTIQAARGLGDENRRGSPQNPQNLRILNMKDTLENPIIRAFLRTPGACQLVAEAHPNLAEFLKLGADALRQMDSAALAASQPDELDNQDMDTDNVDVPPSVDPETEFKPQLESLASMGFTDKETILSLLVETNGNIDAVLDRLCKK